MKKFWSFSFLAISSLLIISACQNTTAEQDGTVEVTELVAENNASVDMKVEGMVCAMGCAKFIEDAVAGIDGIFLSEVNFEEGQAHFEFDENTISAQEIQETINSIHDGQYAATVLIADTPKEQEENEDKNTSSEESEDLSSVHQSDLNISFPELFTYFLKTLRK